jgi:hypothetical protein
MCCNEASCVHVWCAPDPRSLLCQCMFRMCPSESRTLEFWMYNAAHNTQEHATASHAFVQSWPSSTVGVCHSPTSGWESSPHLCRCCHWSWDAGPAVRNACLVSRRSQAQPSCAVCLGFVTCACVLCCVSSSRITQHPALSAHTAVHTAHTHTPLRTLRTLRARNCNVRNIMRIEKSHPKSA